MPSLRTLPADLRTFAKYHLKRRVFDHPAQETQLGLVPLGFDLAEYVAELRALDRRFESETLAEIDYRGKPHPILALRSRNEGTAARRCVVVLAGVHGNEHAGLLAIPEIVRSVEPGAVRLVIVTPVNPVGAAQLSRYNAQGYDINRDFVRFDTLEARLVRDVIGEESPDLVISLHEGPQDATFMFANPSVDAAMARRLLVAMERGGTELATQDYFGRRLKPPGFAPMGRGMRVLSELWARTLQMKSSGMFAHDSNIPELTLESSWRLPDRDARVRAHVDLVRAALGELS